MISAQLLESFFVVLIILSRPFSISFFLFFIVLFPSAHGLWYNIFYHHNIQFFILSELSTFFVWVRNFQPIYSLRIGHGPKMNPIIIFSNSHNYNIIEDHLFLCHIIANIVHFWLKSRIYPEQVPLMTNNKLSPANSFMSIYVF